MAAKILIVEDDHDSLEILKIQLEFMGYEVIEAVNGEDGIKKAQAHLPRIVIMDLGLPDINGIEATQKLKQSPRTAHIPVIAHTAWREEDYRIDAQKAGIAEFLTKPTPPYRFHSTIEKWLNSSGN
jgi:CheY-like chemotaxis protein